MDSQIVYEYLSFPIKLQYCLQVAKRRLSETTFLLDSLGEVLNAAFALATTGMREYP